MLRAALVDLTSGDFSQGASTITMQAARNMFLTFDKTMRRKLQEIFLTYRMEHEFTKEQILQTYLNVIFLGQRSYGVAAAAETYFGKPLDQLSIAEAATLAGIPQAPSRYNPITNPKAAQARRHYVLQQMLKLGDIDAATAQRAGGRAGRSRAITASCTTSRRRTSPRWRAPSSSAATARMPSTTATGSTPRIDGRLQTAADRAVRMGLIEYDRRHGYRGPLTHVGSMRSAGAAQARCSARLTVPEIGDLHPAVVVSVAPLAARVYVRSIGFAQIDWDGLSWARRRISDTRTGAGSAARRGCAAARRCGLRRDRTATARRSSRSCPRRRAHWWRSIPNDGAVVALVGGFDYFDNKFNRATQARRQPGSGFKPFLYSAALEHGFTPASIVMDAPIVYDDSGQEKIWRPENNEKGFDGPMRLREALVHSRNLVTIRVVRQLGIDTAIDYASKFGFNPQDMPKDMTLALGSLPATPLQMATAYAVFANGGYRVDSYFIDRIEDASGQRGLPGQSKGGVRDLRRPAAAAPQRRAPAGSPGGSRAGADGRDDRDRRRRRPARMRPPAAAAAPRPPIPIMPRRTLCCRHCCRRHRIAPRVISPQNAWLMDDMMADVIKRGTGIRAGLALQRDDIAGKTGTTNLAVDTWFNGFNRNIVASVWVGFDQERPAGRGRGRQPHRGADLDRFHARGAA